MTEYVCNENNQDPGHLDAALQDGQLSRHRGPAKPCRVERRASRARRKKPPAPPAGPTPPHTGRQGGSIRRLGSRAAPRCRAILLTSLGSKDLRRAEGQQGQGRSRSVSACPMARCASTPLPYKIVQRPNMVAAAVGGNTHSYRRFFLDGRTPNLDIEPESWTGHSNGKWDGDTLVVDTVGFNDKSWLDSTGKPHSDAMHLVERYRRPDLGILTSS